jgi:hypothetical protein
MVSFHSAGQNDILVEGNVGAGVTLDGIHGYHDMNTIFRNYWNGMEADNGLLCSTGPAGSCFNHDAINLSAGARYTNIIGNVMGTAGYDTGYECVGPASLSPFTCSNQSLSVVVMGYGGQTDAESDFDNTPPTPNDALVPLTTMLWGNYDTVHAAAQWNSAEVPSGITPYPNSVPASHSLPSSFYNGVNGTFSNCGTGLSYWKNPTTGSCPPYPPVGPDVSGGTMLKCTSGAYNGSRVLSASQCAGGSSTAVMAGFANANPAMVCYLNQMGGTPDGTGSMVAFNPSACYTSDGSGGTGSQTLAPPTGLTATVQ